MRSVLNMRILERLKAAGFTLDSNFKACSTSMFGTDTFCKLPGSCNYMRDRGVKLDFEFTVFDESGPSGKGNSKTILLDGDDMLVDGTEFGSGSTYTNSCYVPIMKQEFGNQKSLMTPMFENTWIVGTQVMNKYYTVFD